MTTRRSAPAASTPCWKPARMVTSRQNRNSATAKEPDGQDGADLPAQRLASEQGQELHRSADVREHALVEVERGVGALGRPRVVRHHQDGLAVLVHERLQQVQDLVGALAVEVAGGLVAEQEGGVGHDGARDGHALLLPARQLARLVRMRGRPGPPRESAVSTCCCRSALESGVRSSGSSTLRKAESTGSRLYIWKTKPTCRARHSRELGARRGGVISSPGHGDAARAGHVEAAEEVQQRRLAGARSAP